MAILIQERCSLTADRAEVWDALVDFNAYPDWLVPVRAVRELSDSRDGPRFEMDVEVFTRPFRTMVSILERQTDHHVTLRLSGGVKGVWRFEVEPSAKTGTVQLTFRGDQSIPLPIRRQAAGSVVERHTTRAFNRSLTQLAALLEERAETQEREDSTSPLLSRWAPRIRWKQMGRTAILHFTFGEYLDSVGVMDGIRIWEELRRLGPDRRVNMVWDCTATRSYDAAAGRLLQVAVARRRRELEEIFLITRSPMLKAGARTIQAYSRVPIRLMESIGEIEEAVDYQRAA